MKLKSLREMNEQKELKGRRRNEDEDILNELQIIIAWVVSEINECEFL